MYFDVDMNFITSGFKQISTAAQFQKELVQMDPLVMEWDGYVMAYVSNESDELNYVHFDDFTIYQGKTHVVYASNYTPFGMQFGEFERTASEPVRHKFQEQEHDTSTGWIAFKWRNYNRKYRRFFNIDPLAEKYVYNSTYAFSENNVTAHRELEGLEKWSINVTSEGKVTEKEKQIVAGTTVYTDVTKDQKANFSFKVSMTGEVTRQDGNGSANAVVLTEKNLEGVEITTIKVTGTTGSNQNESSFELLITTENPEKTDLDNGGNLKTSGKLQTGSATESANVSIDGQGLPDEYSNPSEIVRGSKPNTINYGYTRSTKFYWSENNYKQQKDRDKNSSKATELLEENEP